eukprot:GILI01018158.1.p1 GENE.GILI01018158.1~~GILI01018158.1.p1  ORF type:complete len:346 (-),score=36.45 GILI01018158.1:90-1127(-)
MSTSPNGRSLHPSSRDVANELLLLRDSLNIFVFGSSTDVHHSSVAGCAASTFATDRASLLSLSQELRAIMRGIVNHQPTILATPQVTENASGRTSLSPTRRVQYPTNTAVHLQQNPSALHVPPPPISVRQGSPIRKSTEPLQELSQSYGVTVAELRAINPSLSGYNDGQPLPPHSPVRIPAATAHNFASPTFVDVSRSVARNQNAGFHTTPQHGLTFSITSPPNGATPMSNRNGPSLFNAPAERPLDSSNLHPMASPLSPAEQRSTSPKRQHYYASDSLSPIRGLANSRAVAEGRHTTGADTLWALAKEYDVPVRELIRANPSLKAFSVNEVLPPRLIVCIPLTE